MMLETIYVDNTNIRMPSFSKDLTPQKRVFKLHLLRLAPSEGFGTERLLQTPLWHGMLACIHLHNCRSTIESFLHFLTISHAFHCRVKSIAMRMLI
jgi:hypothetical protein